MIPRALGALFGMTLRDDVGITVTHRTKQGRTQEDKKRGLKDLSSNLHLAVTFDKNDNHDGGGVPVAAFSYQCHTRVIRRCQAAKAYPELMRRVDKRCLPTSMI